jgi:RNA polymerase sigma factor (sigma-70 family)
VIAALIEAYGLADGDQSTRQSIRFALIQAYRPQCEELVQKTLAREHWIEGTAAGLCGLLVAFEHVRPEQADDFWSFASHYVFAELRGARLRTVPERDELVTENDGIARSLAKRYARSDSERADCLQEGRLGLLAAARTWREDGGASFASHAYTHARARIYLSIRRARRRGLLGGHIRDEWPTKSFDEPDANDQTEHDRIGTPATQEAALACARALDALPVKHRNAMALLVEGHSYEEIGRALGITRERVRSALACARARLQKTMPPGPGPGAQKVAPGHLKRLQVAPPSPPKTQRQLCKEAGISTGTLWRRMRAGMSQDEALTKKTKHSYKGRLWSTEELAKLAGLSVWAIFYRLGRGMTVEECVETPNRRTRGERHKMPA